MSKDTGWTKMILRFPEDLVWHDKKKKIYWVEVDDPEKLVMGILASQTAKGKAVVIRRDEDE